MKREGIYKGIGSSSKAVLLALVFLMNSNTSSAQNMVVEGNVWTYYDASYASRDSIGNSNYIIELVFTKFYFNGEREIAGHLYKEVWQQSWAVLRLPKNFDFGSLHGEVVNEVLEPHYCFSLREENGRIYGPIREFNRYVGVAEEDLDNPFDVLSRYYPIVDKEYLVYDYSKDTIRALPYIGNSDPWKGFFIIPPEYFPIDGFQHERFLNLFLSEGQLAYQSPMFLSDPFFPEIQPGANIDYTAIRDIPQSPSQPAAQSPSYYDLQGRRLSAPPAWGMYIQDKRVKIRE